MRASGGLQPWALRLVRKARSSKHRGRIRPSPSTQSVRTSSSCAALAPSLHQPGFRRVPPRRASQQQPPREADFERTRAMDEFTGEQEQRIGPCWVLAEDYYICDVPLSEAEACAMEYTDP